MRRGVTGLHLNNAAAELLNACHAGPGCARAAGRLLPKPGGLVVAERACGGAGVVRLPVVSVYLQGEACSHHVQHVSTARRNTLLLNLKAIAACRVQVNLHTPVRASVILSVLYQSRLCTGRNVILWHCR